jgi:hypothetical protein
VPSSDKPKKNKYDTDRDGKVVEAIDMKHRPNLIDTAHAHVWSRELGNEETDDYYAVRCQHCVVGMLISKHETQE